MAATINPTREAVTRAVVERIKIALGEGDFPPVGDPALYMDDHVSFQAALSKMDLAAQAKQVQLQRLRRLLAELGRGNGAAEILRHIQELTT